MKKFKCWRTLHNNLDYTRLAAVFVSFLWSQTFQAIFVILNCPSLFVFLFESLFFFNLYMWHVEEMGHIIVVWKTKETCYMYAHMLALIQHTLNIYTHTSISIYNIYVCVYMGWSLLTCFYCREPRGFGFVQYLDPDDAAEAKYQMDGQILFGRELTVVFAEENRKKPSEMRARERFR